MQRKKAKEWSPSNAMKEETAKSIQCNEKKAKEWSTSNAMKNTKEWSPLEKGLKGKPMEYIKKKG